MIYHVFNKSISRFTIFNHDGEYERMRQLFHYYQLRRPKQKFSHFLELPPHIQRAYFIQIAKARPEERVVTLLAHCLMPNHFHLIIEPLSSDGLTIYLNNTLNAYSRYFNNQHNRRGPLWMSRSKKILIKDESQLTHTITYVHLNPVRASLVSWPEAWKFSSYLEYHGQAESPMCTCHPLPSSTA